jgi:hypothetical protein
MFAAMEPASGSFADSRLLRWAVVAAILGLAAIVVTILILRAIPDEGEVQVEIAGQRLPVGLVVSTDDVRSQLPGIVVDALLGNESAVQINAGRIQSIEDDELEIESYIGSDRATYDVGEARRINVRSPFSTAELIVGDAVAIITQPDSNEALAVLTGVSRAED